MPLGFGTPHGGRAERLRRFALVPKLHLGTHLSAKLHLFDSRRMRSRYHAHESERAYFVTSTVVQWLPVFTTAPRCDILVAALQYCRAHKDLRI